MRTCSKCGEEVLARGLCRRHYNKMRYDLAHPPIPQKSCQEAGCERAYYQRGWCNKHYQREYVYGRIKPLERYEGKTCKVGGCERTDHSTITGLCQVHRKRLKRIGSFDLPPARTCKVAGCDREYKQDRAAGLCDMHYARQWKRAQMGRPGGVEDRIFPTKAEKKARKSAADKKYREENEERVKENHAKWYQENRERISAEAKAKGTTPEQREKARIRQEKDIEVLGNKYVTRILGVKNPPQELIELKRVQLKIYRELQQRAKK